METTIKTFIYLDEDKMFSISSQIFEGITEYLIDYSNNTNEESEEQKGPVGSGRVMADIIKTEKGFKEKKFLHDYSYKLFEEKLNGLGKVLEINSTNINDQIDQIDKYAFLKITSKAIFNDINIINSTLKNFNEMGQAFTYVSNFDEISQADGKYNQVISNTKDRNKKAILKQKKEVNLNLTKLAKKQGLNFDQKYMDSLAFLLEYGFKDQFEFQLPVDSDVIGKTIFSANLKRECLKEDEHLLVRKYSRIAEKEFSIFGIVTQNEKLTKIDEEDEESDIKSNEQPNIKEVLMELVEKLTNVESSFTGRLSNEIIIDPIAIYREL
ncbi:MAG: hypothetical protein HOD92_24060 [Deltaproteobacteria bacterium]|nr:hypothetical protein [Deltaproteobacteria bacterium]